MHTHSGESFECASMDTTRAEISHNAMQRRLVAARAPSAAQSNKMEGACAGAEESCSITLQFKWTDEKTEQLIRWRAANNSLFSGKRNAAVKGFEGQLGTPRCSRVLIRGLHVLLLHHVSIIQADVVQDGTAGNNLCREGWTNLKGLKKDTPPTAFHHTKGPFYDAPCPGVPLVEPSLYRVLHRLSVRCNQADGGSQAGVTSISQYALPLWWIELPDIYRAVFKHPSIMDRPWETHKDIQEAPLMVADGLQLYRVEELPVQVALVVTSRRLYPDVAAINCPHNHTEHVGSSQVSESRADFLQLVVTSGEVDYSAQNAQDSFAHPVDDVMDGGSGDVKGS
ncbi:uncharacterized protein si:ch73-193c12.2 isoform X1 [Cololabis saira]|uniref:uncharacterized protein si:ch73-193c12.2 isoform X1 n=1 Tax=Cololabis saira TaxID=129043 RepID=UPI002AD38A0D|nr:uncharacterized protein si:ch73-193c12.2 isoform X1 [Cololabis saira]